MEAQGAIALHSGLMAWWWCEHEDAHRRRASRTRPPRTRGEIGEWVADGEFGGWVQTAVSGARGQARPRRASRRRERAPQGGSALPRTDVRRWRKPSSRHSRQLVASRRARHEHGGRAARLWQPRRRGGGNGGLAGGGERRRISCVG